MDTPLSDERGDFCRSLGELLSIKPDDIASGELHVGSLADGKYLLVLSVSKDSAACNLLLAEGYNNEGPEGMLALDALGLPDAGGMPYFDTGHGMPGWRWQIAKLNNKQAMRLISDLDNKLRWASGVNDGDKAPEAEVDNQSSGLQV